MLIRDLIIKGKAFKFSLLTFYYHTNRFTLYLVYDNIQNMENIKLLIENELKRVNRELSEIGFEQSSINKAVKELLCSNSKRIRTFVTVLFIKANLIKNISDDTINIITAGEIIHNASLLHDDVLDSAKYRRGNLAFCNVFSPHISILTGDYLLAIAIENLQKVNNIEVSTIFLDCTKKMCSAEINQFFLRGKSPTLSEYIDICAGKTAALFEAIMESSAIIEGLDRNLFKKFAYNFGIFFQLKNDLSEASIKSDSENKINTPKDFLGIEKTMVLIDNYLEKIRGVVRELPDSIYKQGLEDLFKSL